MADGTTKSISAVEVGDLVWATDPQTGETGARRVTALHTHKDIVLDLLTADGATITTTEDHPFWNQTDKQWQQSQQFDEGDQLLTLDGEPRTVDGIDWASARTETAYNFTVDDLHTYYVVLGDDAVLVHNTCPGGSREDDELELTGGAPGQEPFERVPWPTEAQIGFPEDHPVDRPPPAITYPPPGSSLVTRGTFILVRTLDVLRRILNPLG